MPELTPSWKLRRLADATAAIALLFGGCSYFEEEKPEAPKPEPAVRFEGQDLPHIARTVAEYCVMSSGPTLPVQGYGLAVGLGTNGSREAPAQIRAYMIEYMNKKNMGSPIAGTRHLPADRILNDLDTAIVLVYGDMPFGAPVGTRYDMEVEAIPNTQTKSLLGGYLLPAELRMAWMGMAVPGAGSRLLGEAAGSIVVNPFVDANNPKDMPALLRGRLIGGGMVTDPPPLQLQLRQPDYARADLIRKRINQVFPPATGDKDAAVPRDRSTVELNVPQAYKDDYVSWLSLVMHVSLVSGAGWENHARTLIAAMQSPDASHGELALILQTMGRQVVPLIRPLYTSADPAVAFYAARTGIRVGDEAAEDVLIRFAKLKLGDKSSRAGSPAASARTQAAATPSTGPAKDMGEPDAEYQIEAIAELGRHPRLLMCSSVLRELLDDSSIRVRVAACEALVRRNECSSIKRSVIGTPTNTTLRLDQVKTKGSPVIYAWQRHEARIVVFGQDLRIATPVFYNSPDDIVTIRCHEDQKKLSIFRRLPNGRFSETLEIEPDVASLITRLCMPVDLNDAGERGLGISYGQMLTILYQMCERGDIRAKFDLQHIVPMRRITHTATEAGRPDAPRK